MRFCAFCGTEIVVGSQFCGQCGRATAVPVDSITARTAVTQGAATTALPYTPASRSTTPPNVDPYAGAPAQQTNSGVDYSGARSGWGGFMGVIALLGVAALAVGLFLLTRTDAKSTTENGSNQSSAPTESTTTVPADPVLAATNQLQALVTQDRPTADALVGKWVPQLSAKRVGLKADGIVYSAVEILADHTELRNAHGAILVDGGAFDFRTGGKPMVGWFLTIVSAGFDTKALAQAWCIDRGLPHSRCLAREFKPPT
ncbi:MAG: hypothetical protein HY826_11255 [Actinobacteria bacterium]|nr:hypothetical protein [Actinomycetota bacterium]